MLLQLTGSQLLSDRSQRISVFVCLCLCVCVSGCESEGGCFRLDVTWRLFSWETRLQKNIRISFHEIVCIVLLRVIGGLFLRAAQLLCLSWWRLRVTLRSFSFFIQTHSPARSPPSRTNMPTPPSATSPAPTPSTSSSASAWRGPSRPSSGAPRAWRSRWTRETWPSPSPSSPSWPWCASSRCCTGGGRRSPAASWAGRGLARWWRHWCSSRCGCFTSCWLHWRPTAIYLRFKQQGGGERGGDTLPTWRERGRRGREREREGRKKGREGESLHGNWIDFYIFNGKL